MDFIKFKFLEGNAVDGFFEKEKYINVSSVILIDEKELLVKNYSSKYNANYEQDDIRYKQDNYTFTYCLESLIEKGFTYIEYLDYNHGTRKYENIGMLIRPENIIEIGEKSIKISIDGKDMYKECDIELMEKNIGMLNALEMANYDAWALHCYIRSYNG